MLVTNIFSGLLPFIIPSIYSYPSLFNIDYDDINSDLVSESYSPVTDQKTGTPVRRCYSWIENQTCGVDEICIHYQGRFIECVPDSLSNEFDFNQGDIIRKMGKRSGKKENMEPRNPSSHGHGSMRGSHANRGVTGACRALCASYLLNL